MVCVEDIFVSNDKLKQIFPLPRQSDHTSRACSAHAENGAVQAIPRNSLRELLLKAAPGENIEPAVEDFLLDLADDFIDSVTSFACKLAAHRRSDTVEIDDIMVHLERAWGISVSGLWVDGSMKEIRDPSDICRMHKSRMLDLRRAFASSLSEEDIMREKEVEALK
mmetsp:Transcript_11295/g.52481  ORF Transcript_11295/g.52481 Transcript_11295/m.52481 type:complete len:166 (+) Transcript_11295:624-1121(+)